MSSNISRNINLSLYTHQLWHACWMHAVRKPHFLWRACLNVTCDVVVSKCIRTITLLVLYLLCFKCVTWWNAEDVRLSAEQATLTCSCWALYLQKLLWFFLSNGLHSVNSGMNLTFDVKWTFQKPRYDTVPRDEICEVLRSIYFVLCDVQACFVILMWKMKARRKTCSRNMTWSRKLRCSVHPGTLTKNTKWLADHFQNVWREARTLVSNNFLW